MLRDYDAAFDDLGWTPPTEAPKLPGEQEEQDSLGQDAARDGSSNVILDAFRGLGNGVFNAVDNTVGITGIDLGLEDVFGETQTMVGGLVEGFTQFATGFVPVFGALGRVGALSGVGRGLAAGVVADFTVFDAQEERLSNLLVEVPALKNPVTEWLAADEDDGQLEGRLKNVIEGASIGLAFDGFMLALRQLKAGRKAIAEGASPEEAAERVREVEKKAQVEASGPMLPQFGDPSLRTGGEAAVDLVAEAEFIKPNPKRKRGADNLFRRLELEANMIGRGAREDLKRIRTFVDELGDSYFDDVGISIHKNLRSAGRFEFGSQIVRIAKRTIERGDLEPTLIHELWHKLSDHLPAKDVAAVRKSYRKALEKKPLIREVVDNGPRRIGQERYDELVSRFGKDQVQEVFTRSGDGQYTFRLEGDNYRFNNEDEWFAETMREVTQDRLDFLDSAAPSGTVRRLFQDLGVIFRDLYVYTKEKFGFAGPEQRIFNDFLRGKRVERTRSGGFVGQFDAALEDDFSDFILPEIDPEQVRKFVTDSDNRLLLNAVPGIDLNLGVHPRSGDKRTREILGLDPDYYSTVEAAGDYGAEAVSFQIREQIMPQIRETVAADKAYVQGNIEEIQKRMLDTGSRYAKAIGEADAEKALKEMADLNKLSLEAPEQMLEAEVAMQTAMFTMKTIEKDTARHIERLRPRIVDGSATDLELQLFGEVVSVNKQMREAVVRGKSSTGRTLQQFKEQAEFIGGMEGEAVAQAQIKALAERGGREEQLTQARALLALVDEQGPEALMEHLAKTEGKPFLNATLEYWMNSILSGLKTMTVNFMGNAATSLYLPFEGMVGAGARGQWDQVKVYAETYLDLLSSTRDAWNYSKKAFGTFMEEGENVLLPDSRAFAEGEARKAISSEAFGLREESPMGRFLDWAGPKVRVPGRTLQATDEFFKQLNARAIVKRNLRKEALDKGLQGKQLAEYVEGGVDKIIRNGEMFKAQDIYKKAKANVEAQQPKSRDIFDSTTEENIKDAIKKEFNRLWQSEGKFNQSLAEAATAYAEDVTFTKALRPGSRSKGAQDFLVAHPEFRFVVPFVRTPVNILSFAFDRSPIAAANAAKDLILSKAIGKEFPAMSEAQRHLARDLGSSDPAIRSEATGRMIMATGSFFTILSAVSAGTITGRGPNSKEERRALEAAGWQPYSIRIGDTYISYNRMDPFATMIGTIVDYREYGRWADTGDQTILEQQFLAVVSSLAQNFTNKSYVSGIRSFVDLVTDPEANVATEAGRLGASFIPSLVGQNVGAVDPYAREMRTMSDSFRNRIPFLSDNLDPVRNILGEPVDRVRSLGGETIPLANAFLPIATRSTKDRAIATELASLAWPFSPPPKKKQGQDLTQIELSSGHSAYDRWQELTGQVRIGRSTLKSSLKRLIASERYQRLPAESEPGNPSPRVELIRSEIRRFRNRAWRELLKEVPELRQATNQFERGRELRRRGVSVPLGL